MIGTSRVGKVDGDYEVDEKESIPHAFVLNATEWTSRCAFCFEFSATLAPCRQCQAIHYCSSKCQRSDSILHKPECRALPILASTLSISDLSDARLIGRVLNSDAAVRNEDININHMCWHEQDRTDPGIQNISAQILASRLAQDRETVLKTLMKFKANNFVIYDDLMLPIGSGVYPLGSMMNHSCSFNCVATYEAKTKKQIFRATRAIQKGQEIVCSYIDIAASTKTRREKLQANYHFVCQCPSCQRREEQDIFCDTCTATTYCDPVRKTMAAAGNVSEIERALSCRVSALNCKHVHVLELHSRLLELYIDQQNWLPATRHAESIQKIYDLIYGAMKHPIVGLHLYTLGDLTWATGTKQDAVSIRRRVLEYLSTTHGTQHDLTKQLRNILSHDD